MNSNTISEYWSSVLKSAFHYRVPIKERKGYIVRHQIYIFFVPFTAFCDGTAFCLLETHCRAFQSFLDWLKCFCLQQTGVYALNRPASATLGWFVQNVRLVWWTHSSVKLYLNISLTVWFSSASFRTHTGNLWYLVWYLFKKETHLSSRGWSVLSLHFTRCHTESL